MFVVTEADAAAIRATYEAEGELSAAIELRRGGFRASAITPERPCCTDAGHDGSWTQCPQPSLYLSDTDRVRASERLHPVQGSGSKGNLGRLGPVGARSQGVADHTFVSPDRRFNLGPQIVAAGFLPGHVAAIGDHPKIAVALCRSGFGRRTRHRAGAWRHDDGGVWMTLGNSPSNLTEAAASLGVSPMTVLRIIRSGVLEGHHLCKGAPWVITQQSVENAKLHSLHRSRQGALTENAGQNTMIFQ
jgi:hypothetical protein